MVKISRLEKKGAKAPTLAFIDIDVNGSIIKGFRLVSGKKGAFLALPSILGKGRDGRNRYFWTFKPSNELRKTIEQVVLKAYTVPVQQEQELLDF